eukprot:CAMPEP_0181364404 /NCGR_PEP_ID=MMETSP1106-20121128/9375_1 /TAXON_ID=81844 /ORGANISM="Mantoniella antarctica, Strain SL-175" /LENGTH=243 /DNA_ID=CAMNT_0023479129 /DNA_START=361 /DNA_END=1092 /DNA_ORIENTATION=-
MPSSGDDEPSSGSGSLPADASIGYDPTGGDEYYVGAGKYIRGDTGGVMTGTGRDELVGGFAGGEKGLLQYRDVLATDSRLTPTRAVFYGGRYGSDEVSLGKDFGGMAGGFPGGEIGVMAFNETGEVATRDNPPTLGWAPPVLLLATIGAAGYFLNPGGATEELGNAVRVAADAKTAVEEAVARSPETALLLVEVGAAGAGLFLVSSALSTAANKAGVALNNAARLGLLYACALAIAGKVIELY